MQIRALALSVLSTLGAAAIALGGTTVAQAAELQPAVSPPAATSTTTAATAPTPRATTCPPAYNDLLPHPYGNVYQPCSTTPPYNDLLPRPYPQYPAYPATQYPAYPAVQTSSHPACPPGTEAYFNPDAYPGGPAYGAAPVCTPSTPSTQQPHPAPTTMCPPTYNDLLPYPHSNVYQTCHPWENTPIRN